MAELAFTTAKIEIYFVAKLNVTSTLQCHCFAKMTLSTGAVPNINLHLLPGFFEYIL
jgi:hypothetical protein